MATDLCEFCRRKRVKRKPNGWPMVYCSNECRKKAHSRLIGQSIGKDGLLDQYREPRC